MPDGVLKWFDPKTGEAAVVRHGREFLAQRGEVEAVARHPGARVHFDIHRARGVEEAVGVRLRVGTRVSHRHHRFGTLEGARQADEKGALPYANVHPELEGAGLHPLEIARAWASSVSRGDLDGALALYAPDAVVHLDDSQLSGPRALGSWLEASTPFDGARHAQIHGQDEFVVVSWEASGPGEAATSVRCAIDHSQITEQWIEGPAALVAQVTPSLSVELSRHGAVPDEMAAAARDVVRAAADRLSEPVLFARVKLRQENDPARVRPAVAEAALDVDGDVVRAHVAAPTMSEALDRLGHRLSEQLGHRATRRERLHRSAAQALPGEWRHSDLPTVRPPHFDRPPEERQLVREKTFAVDELTPDEAVFDMDQLDYDFYLFSDLASGLDSMVERLDDGSYRMTRIEPSELELGPTAVPIDLSRLAVPELGLSEAIERIGAGNEPRVFFCNRATRRGNVLYVRQDGNYGVITPA